MINPLWLQTFCSLIETQNFTRTAERLFMTQSGVSQHIKKLEQQLNLQLINRKDKQFEVTESGLRLYQESKPILSTLTNLKDSLSIDAAFKGEIKIMSPGSIGLKLYPFLLQQQSQHQQLVIDHRFAPNDDIEQKINERKADIGLMTRIPKGENCSFEYLSKENLLLVTPKSINKPLLTELSQLGFIDHPDGQHHANLLLSANFDNFKHINQIPKRGFSNQISLILEPVCLGLGFTVLPENAVDNFSNKSMLNTFALQKPINEPLYMVTQQSALLPKRIHSMLEIIKQGFKHS